MGGGIENAKWLKSENFSNPVILANQYLELLIEKSESCGNLEDNPKKSYTGARKTGIQKYLLKFLFVC